MAENNLSGLTEAIKTARIHEEEVAWQVSCPTMGKEPMCLFYEKDSVLAPEEEARGYLVHGRGVAWTQFLAKGREIKRQPASRPIMSSKIAPNRAIKPYPTGAGFGTAIVPR
ncbi:hypothetical protein [Thermodesulforhabdus norvegica]|uniref:Uncharacterized protein n=1 Tax=Thermodesulforhabdus norvegica TaxID=39841 RepID=A0A1I4VFG7_9BACT|nr:hypothetical protein [Thermodesulforhabdus norvegica]SFM99891.1 hypothetical protein SAMN05660836_02273 [Thermodesulforhabdus norvegica]